jgi:hypothetical protein
MKTPRHWTINDFFWSRVQKDGPTVRADLGQCWIWKGSRQRANGYGRINFREVRNGYAHRFSLQLAGIDPGDFYVCHKCDNPPCVRPDHLFLGTPADNAGDAKAKGRARGPARLTKDEVIAIRSRRAQGAAVKALALEYGVAEPTIWGVVRGQNWKRLPMPNKEFEARRKTHCKQGHERAVHGFRSGQQWRCRICQQEVLDRSRMRLTAERKGITVDELVASQQRRLTHCPSGHLRAEHETVYATGKKQCQACEAVKRQRRREKKLSATPAT